ncbi:MAG TPA: MFS transporter [Nocardioidaceae bacterium]|nr:MFS transporter [Nocardioidaceae bacterium]
MSPMLALRYGRFRVLVLIQLANAVGVWMHVVAAQWMFTEAGRSATVVAAVPAAMSVPFFLLCLPVGALVGRVSAVRMMAAATALSALASLSAALLAAHQPGNVPLLLLTVVAIGSGLVALAVAWQSQIPHLVDRPAVGSAAVVDGATFNLARAVGPVAGGVGLSLLGPAATFVVTSVLFSLCTLCVVGVVPRRPTSRSKETLVQSIRGGLRFTRNSPWTRRLLVRLCLFGVPSAALWALLPLVVHQRLGLDSRGFGVLFGMVGLGAVGGTVLLAPVRARLSVNHFGFLGSALFGAMLFGLALTSSVPVVAGLLVLGGASWVGVQTTWMTAAHQALPDWVRPRIIALILLAFQGCQALGALSWGTVADVAGLDWALGGAAALMGLAALGFLRHGLYDSEGIEPEPAAAAAPSRADSVDPDQPIRVEVTYLPSAHQVPAFLEAVDMLRQSRLRLGAGGWELLVDPTEPDVYVETYPVRSWAEYVAAETVRLTVPEQRLRERVRRLLDQEPRTRVLVREPDHRPTRGADR